MRVHAASSWPHNPLPLVLRHGYCSPLIIHATLGYPNTQLWTFLLRVILHCNCSQLFQELELLLFSRFLPAMFGVEVSAVERYLFALPLRLGGLGICNPVSLASHLFNQFFCL